MSQKVVTKEEWVRLVEDRVKNAEVLLNAGMWSGAYYMAGYAIECGLKACVVTCIGKNPGVVYGESGYYNLYWTHKFDNLLRAADLRDARDADSDANVDLGKNWMVVKDWDESSRYQQQTEAQARKLFEAITDSNNGVLQWVKARW